MGRGEVTRVVWCWRLEAVVMPSCCFGHMLECMLLYTLTCHDRTWSMAYIWVATETTFTREVIIFLIFQLAIFTLHKWYDPEPMEPSVLKFCVQKLFWRFFFFFFPLQGCYQELEAAHMDVSYQWKLIQCDPLVWVCRLSVTSSGMRLIFWQASGRSEVNFVISWVLVFGLL